MAVVAMRYSISSELDRPLGVRWTTVWDRSWASFHMALQAIGIRFGWLAPTTAR
ncbi:MAG: hypothetical protein OXQ90_10065 [Gammaproteobacteria bacterium]|nr:hypothetical protein [Gammaproteobacteria bacterium]